MNPIPLSDQAGRVYAYACGVCHHVSAGSALLYMPDTPGPVRMLVENSERGATQCCSCLTCGSLLRRGWMTGAWCATCRWWMEFGSVWYRIGSGYNGKVCPICRSAENDYCRKTPKCIDCNEGHGNGLQQARQAKEPAMTLDLFEWRPHVMPKVTITRAGGWDPESPRANPDPTLPPARPPTIEERALSFHTLNPHVFAEMLRLARAQLAKGPRWVGAKSLWEDLRASLATTHGEFKLNNTYTAWYSRKLIEAEPRIIGVIEVRQRKSR